MAQQGLHGSAPSFSGKPASCQAGQPSFRMTAYTPFCGQLPPRGGSPRSRTRRSTRRCRSRAAQARLEHGERPVEVVLGEAVRAGDVGASCRSRIRGASRTSAPFSRRVFASAAEISTSASPGRRNAFWSSANPRPLAAFQPRPRPMPDRRRSRAIRHARASTDDATTIGWSQAAADPPPGVSLGGPACPFSPRTPWSCERTRWARPARWSCSSRASAARSARWRRGRAAAGPATSRPWSRSARCGSALYGRQGAELLPAGPVRAVAFGVPRGGARPRPRPCACRTSPSCSTPSPRRARRRTPSTGWPWRRGRGRRGGADTARAGAIPGGVAPAAPRPLPSARPLRRLRRRDRPAASLDYHATRARVRLRGLRPGVRARSCPRACATSCARSSAAAAAAIEGAVREAARALEAVPPRAHRPPPRARPALATACCATCARETPRDDAAGHHRDARALLGGARLPHPPAVGRRGGRGHDAPGDVPARARAASRGSVAYVQPSRRPARRPLRREPEPPLQAPPVPGDPEAGARRHAGRCTCRAWSALGIDPAAHDVRFEEDNWESPTLGAWGIGWQVLLDGQEITQFTYFQQAGGIDLAPISAEITYGLERIAMYLQDVDDVYDVRVGAGRALPRACGTRRSTSSRATRSSWRTSSCSAASSTALLKEGWRVLDVGGRTHGAGRLRLVRSRPRTRSTCSTRAAPSRSASARG